MRIALVILFLLANMNCLRAQNNCDDENSCNYGLTSANEIECCYSGCYTVTVFGGLFDSEIQWNLLDAQDQVLYSGVAIIGVPYVLCLEDGCYKFEMFDSFGDGWNGATYTIQNSANELIRSGSLDIADYGDGFTYGVDYFACPNTSIDCVFLGCGDPVACNYNEEVTISDDSCDYLSCAGCTDDGFQDESAFPGTSACNYDPTATIEDGSCTYDCFGCTDPEGCNFNENSTSDNGLCCLNSCFELQVFPYTEGNFVDLSWSITVIGSSDIIYEGEEGEYDICLDSMMCYQFNFESIIDDNIYGGNYVITDPNNESEVVFTSQFDDVYGVDYMIFNAENCYGCKDDGTLENSPFPGISACNFDSNALLEDESCEYDSCIGCTDPSATNYNSQALIDNNSCVYCGIGETLFTLEMIDLNGQSGEGIQYVLTDFMGTLEAFGSLGMSQYGNQNFHGYDHWCLSPDCYYFEFTGPSDSQSFSWNLHNDDGTISVSGIESNAVPFDYNFQIGNVCDSEGCLSPECWNYSSTAIFDGGGCVCPPENDLRCNAIALECGDEIVGTLENASDDESLIGTGCSFPIEFPGVWYSYSPEDDHYVEFSTFNSETSDCRIHVFRSDQCEGDLECIVGSNSSIEGELVSASFHAILGETYYVRVSSPSPDLPYTVNVNCTDCEQLPNDVSANADLVELFEPYISNTCCSSSEEINLCQPYLTVYDQWIRFNSADWDTFYFTFSMMDEDLAAGLKIFKSFENPFFESITLIPIACCAEVSSCEGHFYDIAALEPNTDYYMAIWNADLNNCGEFQIIIEGHIMGCTDPNSGNYDPTATLSDGSCTWSGPSEDVCSGAINIACGSVTEGNNSISSAIDAPNQTENCEETPFNGVWYTFQGTGDLHQVSTCGSPINTKLNLYSLPSGSNCQEADFSCVAFQNDAGEELCGLGNEDDVFVEFESDPDLDYYLYVGFDFLDGEYLGGEFEIVFNCIGFGCTGDFDEDGSIGAADLLTFLSSFGCMENCVNDLNGDGMSNSADLLVFLAVYGEQCNVVNLN